MRQNLTYQNQTINLCKKRQSILRFQSYFTLITSLFHCQIIFLILILQHPKKSTFSIRQMSYYHRDQLSIRTNKILGNIFAQQILLSQKVQNFRQILASVPYYDCVQLFRVLDKEEKGYLTLDDFMELIGENHKKLVTYAFGWFDQAKLGQVSRLQFISFLMPRRNQQLRQLTARRLQQPINDPNFSTTINQQLRIFTQLLNSMISHQLKIIDQRKLLLKQQDYSIKGVLRSLDVNAHQFVSTVDVIRFLQSYAIEATHQQVEDFLEIVDSRLQGKITLEQLKWIVEGLENSSKEYLKKIKKSSKKSHSRRKDLTVQLQQTPAKQFVRTPVKSTNRQQQSISHSRSYQANQLNSQQASRMRNSNYDSRETQQLQYSRKNRTQKKQEKLKDKPSLNDNFDIILSRYKQAERESAKRDAELIKAELQIKNKLLDQFQRKSVSRRRALTEVNSMVSQSRRKEEPPHYQKNIIKNENRASTAVKKDREQPLYQRDFIKNEQRASTATKRDSMLYEPFQLNYHYPDISLYDRKINTIVQNFYRINTDPFTDVTRKYGTMSSFANERPRSISTSFDCPLYDQPSKNKLLQDQLYGDKFKVKPFDHTSTILKEEINKKLGDDLFNIKLSNRRYDPVAHQARQKPVEENIKRLKETTQQPQAKSRNFSDLSPKMMENISIISRETPKIQVSAAKPQQRQLNIYRTDAKTVKTSTPSSAYQSLTSGQMTKNRGQHTTETRYPTRQTESKIQQPSYIYQRRKL